MFESRVFREIFVPKREELRAGRRNLHTEELLHFYTSPNIIRVLNSRRMGWPGHVARMGGEERCVQCFGGED
jgi:hypothetical protein